jgi:histidinol-phosphate phosphatase family protein
MCGVNEYDGAASRPAVFLDRDGTLIEDRGHICRPEDVRFFSATFVALRRLQDHFPLFVVSNQSGVSEGVLTAEDVERVNAHILARLANAGVRITDVYWCPHKRSDRCMCIKPNPYFLLRAVEEHRVDLRRSYVIGDHPHDVYLAENVGAQGIYVLSGHGRRHCRELTSDCLVVAGIAEAVEWIRYEKMNRGKSI